MKTLYLSDLDGTLLRSNERLSEYTQNTVNNFTKNGMHFSYATARSLVSASKVTAGLTTEFPVICYNGGFIFGGNSKEILRAHYFTKSEIEYLTQTLAQHGFLPIVYAFIGGVEHFSFIEEGANDGMRHFLDARLHDPRRRQVQTVDELYTADVFYLICMGEILQLAAIDAILNKDKRFYSIFHKETYSDTWWCEILPAKSTKAAAALELKAMLGCEKLVAFGDGKNDIPLFTVADECYAMANAVPELKEIATAIINSNDNDGVAKWLERNWQ